MRSLGAFFDRSLEQRCNGQRLLEASHHFESDAAGGEFMEATDQMMQVASSAVELPHD
jgi:hypothetical protein